MPSRDVPLYLQPATHPQARACAACAVREQALFGVLDADGLSRLHVAIATPAFAADEALWQAGTVGMAMYTLRSGIVRFERVTAAGDRRIVRLAGPGHLIGQETLLSAPHADDAVACTPVQACRLPRTLVDELARSEPQVVRELMRRWQAAVVAAEQWASELTAGPARRRVLSLLHQLVQLSDGDDGTWLPRREDMGAMLDLTTETASRIVSALRREGVLQALSKQHVRVDAQRLDAARHAADAG